MAQNAWWAVARTEEVTSAKPINVDIADQPVVLWRDHEGAVHALEDRCPHRRAPLSRGCVLGNGMLQCGYHGWTFDGATGHLKNIPNLKSDAKFPPIYHASAFAVAESGGFVRVCLDGKAAAPAATVDTLPLSGTVQVALDHENYIAALFDDPGLVLAIRAVRFTPYLAAELGIEDGRLVMERSCQWAGPRWPSPFSSDFPLALRISTDALTGESELLLRDDALRPVLSVRLAPVPAARGVTQVRWRARLFPDRQGLRGRVMGTGAPITLLSAIDAAALRILRPSASIHASALRAQLAAALAQSSAA